METYTSQMNWLKQLLPTEVGRKQTSNILTTVATGTGLILVVWPLLKEIKKRVDFSLRWTVAEAAGRYNRSHGRIVSLKICGNLAYVSTHADIIDHVMYKNTNNYKLRPGETWGLTTIGMQSQGIIWNQHLDKFKINRSCFDKALAQPQLEHGTSIAAREAERWCLAFSETEQKVDMMDAMGELAVRIALPLFFGIDSHQIAPQCLQELRDAIKGYFEAWEFFLVKPAIYRMFDRFLELLGRRSLCHEAKLKVARVRRAVDAVITPEIMQDSIFLQSISNMPHEDRRQMCIELLLASADTSSITLYYTLVLLAKRPDLIEVLRAELESVCGQGTPSEENLKQLPKLEAVLKESMRLKPVGPMILRTAVSDDTMAVGGKTMTVQKGTHFFLNIRDYHMDQDYFPEPHLVNLHRYEDCKQERMFLPFGRGPKGCVGKFFAMREMKVILSQILQNLEFSTPDDFAGMETRWDIANHPTSPSPFRVRRRSAALK